MTILPRFIRHKDAFTYLGVDRNKFDAEIRPNLTEIPLGSRSIAFDRLELDAWADEFKRIHGRPGRKLAAALFAAEMASKSNSVANLGERSPNGKDKRKNVSVKAEAKGKKLSNLEKVRKAIEETRNTLLR